ncbi:MAG: M3 family oligoendopeptidase [Nitrospinae bacterium]|nr:M3 family oligoendopeptidase [Nitrospinota bacterium]
MAPYPRTFVDAHLEVKGWDELAPYYRELSEAPIASAGDLSIWLARWSELKGVADEFVTRRYVDMTCHTDDPAKKEAYLMCVREVEPKLTEWEDRLNRRYLDSSARPGLDKAIYGQMDRMIKTSVELFDERNIPLQVVLQELSQKYQETMGAMTVVFDGAERTMPQMGAFLREPDRALRERAFRATVERRLKEKDALEDLFDQMLEKRAEFAANLKLADYREYCFKGKLRDYSPEDCLKFHEAIEKTAVPLMRRINERRKSEMGVETLCPWDTACDPKGRPPLKPFSKAEELFNGVAGVFGSVNGRLGELFSSIGFSMDLESRKGKAPGGYQTTLSEARIPFIFTNAVGLQDDVNTLLHEGGHAFHTLMSRDNPIIWNRHSAMEFAEVASMSMELLGGDHLEPFYASAENRRRAKEERLEGVVSIFPWVAQVDAFQHWIYTHPGHGRDDRRKAWVELSERFNTGVDWSQAPAEALDYSWHRQLHIFEVPFYYIEYAVAQLGALQVYRNYGVNQADAVEKYLAALALGGSRPAPELFEAAGARFDFDAGLLGGLMDIVAKELGI